MSRGSDKSHSDVAPKSWIKVDKFIVDALPKDRRYTVAEAYLSLRIDLDNNTPKGLREYARIWHWSRGSVENFFKNIGYKSGSKMADYPLGHSKDTCKTRYGLIFNDLDTTKKTTLRHSKDTTSKTKTKDKDKKTYVASPSAVPRGFDHFWFLYPARRGRKRGKKEAQNYWESKGYDDATIQQIYEATGNYKEEEPEFIRDAVRFLRNDYWRDFVGDRKRTTPKLKVVV